MKRSDTMRGPIRMWLVVIAGGRPERAVEIGGDRFVIGRGPTCDLVLDDARVSREHAAIVPGPGGRRLLCDLDSANGTLVNGRPIPTAPGFRADRQREMELWGEERLQIGDTLIVTTTQDPATLLSHLSTGEPQLDLPSPPPAQPQELPEPP